MASERMKYPIGMQSFEDLRRKVFVYVDKTRQIYEIVKHGKCYFLGRPRRFGKSLLLSTLEAYFLGKKELFKGLAIEKLETEWAEYPVLYLDLNTAKYVTECDLIGIINNALLGWEKLYASSDGEDTLSLRFRGVIERAYLQTGKQVVILVDEYDKPLVNTFDNRELQDKYRTELKAFYSVLKTQDRYIRFAFLTGVTKFGKVSVFSDLNNLNDISMDKNYADICGMTEQEVLSCFDSSLRELASENGLTYDEVCQKLKDLYDGYHFCLGGPGIYNPFSLLKAFSSGELGSYWYETGTPTFLVQLLKNNDYDLNDLQNQAMTASELRNITSVDDDPIPIIYQSGYLTIKGYNPEFGTYTLGFPNKEVETGFIASLVPQYLSVSTGKARFSVTKFITDVRRGDPEAFLTRLQTFFEDADYRIAGKKEIYFQNAMYVIFKMMGFYTKVERTTSRGRIDVVLKTKDYIYIIECKLDGSADEAMRQIEEKGYAKPYAMDSRKLFKIGVNFSSEIRGISEWKVSL